MSKITPMINNSLPSPIRRTADEHRSPSQKVGASGSAGSFAVILEDQQQDNTNVKLSIHAQERLKQQNINISSQDMGKISDAADRAEKKGSRESLMLLRDLALVVNINNRTVITAVDKTRQKERIFTNIDSTVIL